MGKNQGGKCCVCGIEKVPLVDAKMKEGNGTIDVKVCKTCWKNLWADFFKSKEVKIA